MFISELKFEDILKVVEPDFSCLVTVYDNDDGKNFVRALITHYQPIYIGKAEWPVIGEDVGRFWEGLQVHDSFQSGLILLENSQVEKGSVVFINEDTLEAASLDAVRKILSDFKVFFLCRIDKSVKNRANLRMTGKMREFVSTSIVLYPDNLMGYSTIDVVNFKSGKEIENKRFKLDNLKAKFMADKKAPAPVIEDSNPKHALLRRLARKAEDDRSKLQFLNDKIKKMLSRSIGVSFVMNELSCSEDEAQKLVREFKVNLEDLV